jgi:hypothetical protein
MAHPLKIWVDMRRPDNSTMAFGESYGIDFHRTDQTQAHLHCPALVAMITFSEEVSVLIEGRIIDF